MDMTDPGLGYPKGALGVESRRAKRLSHAEAEAICRAEVKRLYGTHCCIPGCRKLGIHQHHIVYRSRSRRLKYEPTNRAPICQTHHDLLHAGKITIHPRTAEGELIITGERKYLAFKV